MQAIGAPVGIAAGCQRKQAGLAHGQFPARRSIGRVIRAAGGDNQAAAVVAALKKQAHEGLVIGGNGGRGGAAEVVAGYRCHDAELAEGGEDAGGADGGAAGLADERATGEIGRGRFHGVIFGALRRAS